MDEKTKTLAASSYTQNADGQNGQRRHDTEAVLVYTTFPSADDAKKAGRALVEGGLAACVNVFSPMTAIFVWEGVVEEEGETAMIVKTTSVRSEEVLAEIKRLHPYSVPARLVLPVIGGGEDFLGWISTQCCRVSKV